MPVVSSFFGIVIRMYYRDHEPPHFHAEYQGQSAVFDLSGEPIGGTIESRTARRLIKAWASGHEAELRVNWERIERGLGIRRIEPLR